MLGVFVPLTEYGFKVQPFIYFVKFLHSLRALQTFHLCVGLTLTGDTAEWLSLYDPSLADGI